MQETNISGRHMFLKLWMLNTDKTTIPESQIPTTIQWVKESEEFIIRGVFLKDKNPVLTSKMILLYLIIDIVGDLFIKMAKC